jgi:hypothetical protein
MARKVLNRKALREEVEAAEQAAGGAASEEAPAKAPAKRKKRTKETPVERIKLYWGVYNQTMKCVAKYEYSQKRDAEKKAAALTESGKSAHFIQKIREVIAG